MNIAQQMGLMEIAELRLTLTLPVYLPVCQCGDRRA